MAQYYGYNPPFFGGHQNVLSRQADERLIKNDLLQLLMTNRGERVMRPFWGGNIRSMLFENVGVGRADAIARDVKSTIETYESRIVVDDVQVGPADDQNILRIRIEGRYSGERNRQFEMDINLPFSAT